MIVFDKLFCQINDNLNFDSQIRQIFGLGVHNNIYKKFGLLKNAHSGVIKIVEETFEFDIEYYILKERFVSFPLKQEIKDNIRKKIVKRIYQGFRHKVGLPVHGQRTHTNCKTIKKIRNINVVYRSTFKSKNLIKQKTINTLKNIQKRKIKQGSKKGETLKKSNKKKNK